MFLFGSSRYEIAVRRLCLAADKQNNLGEAARLLTQFEGRVGVVKFNALFVLLHNSVVRMANNLGYDVWVDLKSHDIPDTIKDTVGSLRLLGVKICTVHLSGGSEMIRAAVEAAGNPYDQNGMLALGITVLTSINQKVLNEELRVPGTVAEQVIHLARLGKQNGIHGVVCSGLEAADVRKEFGPGFFIATPGLRFEGHEADRGQKRIVTPYNAFRNGSDLGVMGSELIRGGVTAADQAVKEIRLALLSG